MTTTTSQNIGQGEPDGGPEARIRVLLLTTRDLIRRGMRSVLLESRDLELIAQGAGPSYAIGRAPDILILDSGGAPDALHPAEGMRRRDPGLPSLVLGHGLAETKASAADRDATGYLLDGAEPRQVREIIRASVGRARGDEPLAPEPEAVAEETQLTLREAQVLRLIAEGLTNREIGQRLGLAVKTVKNYTSSLFAKLHIEHRTQAVVYWLSDRHGLAGREFGEPGNGGT